MAVVLGPVKSRLVVLCLVSSSSVKFSRVESVEPIRSCWVGSSCVSFRPVVSSQSGLVPSGPVESGRVMSRRVESSMVTLCYVESVEFSRVVFCQVLSSYVRSSRVGFSPVKFCHVKSSQSSWV